jgi:hypothetical protein
MYSVSIQVKKMKLTLRICVCLIAFHVAMYHGNVFLGKHHKCLDAAQAPASLVQCLKWTRASEPHC